MTGAKLVWSATIPPSSSGVTRHRLASIVCPPRSGDQSIA
jgi:hypothetical protein